MSRLSRAIRVIAKDVSLQFGSNSRFFDVYPYMFNPHQLVFLTECIKSVANVAGCFVEVGCAHGATTVFLNKFMNVEGIKRDYYAIDTFSGFVAEHAEHAEHEIHNRGKPTSIKKGFSENKKAWFDKSMILHDLKQVKSVERDATKFDFSAIAPIAFCLLDVDLYMPMKDVLPKIYAAASSGGIIVVDDCQPHELDGALQAYQEFVQEKRLPTEIVAEKLGIVRG